MLLAESISKRYGSKLALDALDLSVSEGCVLGFIGPNGAGKSTAMRIFAGTMPPSSGRVVVCGFDMADASLAAKDLIGYLPENAPLYQHMRVGPFLDFCARMRGVPEGELKRAVGVAVERCALASVLDEDVEALSKGFRRRVCLAQAIVRDPKILLLDEPTDGLDPIQKAQIRSLIREMRESRAIIVSTHILEEVGAVCDRVLALRDGRKIFDGDVAAFKAAGRRPALELRLRGSAPVQKLLDAFAASKSLGKASLSSEFPGGLLLRVEAREGHEGSASVEALDIVRASAWSVESLETIPCAGFDEIFTGMVDGSMTPPESEASR